jgi:Lung seven transmembrane receptor
MASTFTTNRSNRLFAPRRRRSRRPYNWMPLLVAAQVVMILISSLSSSVVTMVQAANFENTTTVTLKNTRIAAPGVQQVQGKILYNNGFVDLSTLVFSVATTGDGSDSSSSAAAAAANSEEFYYMDLAILEVPQICNNDNNDEDSSNSSAPQPQQDGPTSDSTTRQCDWAEAWTLGVSIPSGQKNSMGEPELWWCCTKHAMGYGACTQEQYGRLLINETLFHGQRAYLPIPSTATASNFLSPLPPEASGFGFTQAGMYTLILANCNEAAPALMVNGDTIWTSYNEMEIVEQAIPFYIILGIGYAILTSWFWYLLQNNKSSRIKLEEWIFATIALGFMEMLFRTIDFLAWGSSGANVPILSLVGTCHVFGFLSMLT